MIDVISDVLTKYGIPGTIITLMSVLEISKIKINPWSMLLGWIGRAITKDIEVRLDRVSKLLEENNDEIKMVSKKVDDNDVSVNKKIDTNEAKRIRAEILAFADTCKRGNIHDRTKDEFEHIMGIHDEYDGYVEKHELKNGFLASEYDYIMRVYSKYQAEIETL